MFVCVFGWLCSDEFGGVGWLCPDEFGVYVCV